MGAAVRFVARVGAHVALKEPRPRERLTTDIALVIQIVGEDVHGEGRHRDVHLVANVALFGAVGIERAVGLLMTRQVGAGGIVLTTL